MDIDFRDLMLEAAAEIESLMQELERDLNKPKMKAKFARLWREMPDEQKEAFRRDKPNEYRVLMDALQ